MIYWCAEPNCMGHAGFCLEVVLYGFVSLLFNYCLVFIILFYYDFLLVSLDLLPLWFSIQIGQIGVVELPEDTHNKINSPHSLS